MNLESLRAEFPYKIELHAHTSPASPCSEVPPEEAVRRYRALGADALAITNHFNLLIWDKEHDKADVLRRYYDDYLRAKAEGERLGMTVYFAMEIRFSENANDYLIYGIDETFLAEAYETLDGTLAEFVTACKKDGMFLAQAHPFRDMMTRMDPSLLDGIEVYNLHHHHNSRISLAERFARAHGKAFVGGTDFHHPDQEGMCFIRTRSLPRDSFELAQLLHSQDFIFQLGESLLLF